MGGCRETEGRVRPAKSKGAGKPSRSELQPSEVRGRDPLEELLQPLGSLLFGEERFVRFGLDQTVEFVREQLGVDEYLRLGLEGQCERIARARVDGDQLAVFLEVDLGEERVLAKIHDLDAAETQRWQQAAAGTRAAWYKEVAAKGIDGEKLAKDAEALVDKYTKAQ